MSLGLILLVAVGLLILFGVAQRVLDRMRLSDRWALAVVAAIFLGSFIPDIHLGNGFYINVGGAIIPLALCVYLFVKAGTGKERFRAIAAALVGGGIVLLAGRLLPDEPEAMWFDPNYIYGLLAGLAAYLMGRSRRSAFIGGVVGVLLADLAQGIINRVNGLSGPVYLGGGGALDVVVISGLLAVILADVIGEIRERAQGGTAKTDMEYNQGRFVHEAEFADEDLGARGGRDWEGSSENRSDRSSHDWEGSAENRGDSGIHDWKGSAENRGDSPVCDWESPGQTADSSAEHDWQGSTQTHDDSGRDSEGGPEDE